MAADSGIPFQYFLPLALCLAGFHGTFFYFSLWKKAASWCAFQAGLVLLLFLSAPTGNALAHDLEILITAATLAVFIYLSFFCAKGEGRLKPAESGKKSRRNFK